MSALLDRSAAEEAVSLALPLLEQARQHRQVGESGFLHLVIMHPGHTPSRFAFEEAILFEYSVGDRSQWDADYATFARAKAKLSWRSGLDSQQVQERAPHWLEPGDTLLWGSVNLDGIVVGVSGANPWFDEAFAGTVALLLRAVIKGRHQKAMQGGPWLAARTGG